MLALLDAIQAGRQERELEAEIIERLQLHADQHIFTSLPRTRPRGPGSRCCWPSSATYAPASLPSKPWPPRVGAAPVTITSGKRRVVKFRWACDKKLRAALLDLADDSRHASPWAAKIDAEAIQRTRHHPHAVRILARAWIRVIWRIWQDGVAYDPTKHQGVVKLLATRG